MDGRADQYSLAATAFHLLTGSQLFPDSNPVVVATRHVNVPPPALADRRPELAGLDTVLAIGLAKRPEDRFARCSDFARAFSEQLSPAGAPTQTAPTKPARISGGGAPREPTEGPSAPHQGDKKARTPWLFATIAAVVAVVLTAGLIAMWRPWERQGTRSPQESAGPSTSVVDSRPPAIAPTAAPPPPAPPPPTFSPKAIDQVLLSAAQLSKVLGVTVSSSPAGGGGGGLAITSTSYGMSDHSGQVTPPACVGLVFTGEHDVFAPADPSAIKVQVYGNLYGSGSNAGPYRLEQMAAVLTSAEQAQQFLKSSQSQWETCGQSTVDATLGYENGRGYTLGTVKRQRDLITVPMASNGGETGPDACQQALGAAENVVVETRTCATPNTTAAPGYSNPNWASDDAERVAKAMLENVGP
jgi:serine/threonine-protein kinase